MGAAFPTGLCFLALLWAVDSWSGQGSSTTSYWYGGSLHPLVVERDGVTYRLIGKAVLETMGSSGPTRAYLHADHLGSVRVVTDDQGSVSQSLSYDGDYGATRIAGESAAASFDSMASFYRFQGQEQDIFPLTKLGIDNSALAQWLDQIGLYHFPWRDYTAGLAAFAQTDPVPTEDSLYGAFAGNPANFTDETGGMIWHEARYTPAHLQVSDRLQTLLDRLLQDPSANFEFSEVVELSKLRLAIVAQRINRNNPFAPDGILGKRHLETYLGHVEVTDQRHRDARQAFAKLRREQDRWLSTYSRPIGQLWERTMVRRGRNIFDEVEEKPEAEEPPIGQDHPIAEIERNGYPFEAPDEEGDSKMPELLTDFGSGKSQPPSPNEISVQNPPVPSVEENGADVGRQQHREEEEHGEEHRNDPKTCCHIL